MTKLSDWNLCTYLFPIGDIFDFGVEGLYKYEFGALVQISPYSPYLENGGNSWTKRYLYKKTTADGIYEYDAAGYLISFTEL